jgi:1-phosphatidylinositol-4-phosphate 5-kinase
VKRIENFLKGMSGHESQISPVPSEFYGERFLKFISGTTMSREEAERQMSLAADRQGNVPIVKHNGSQGEPSTSQDLIMERAEREAAKRSRDGNQEDEKPDRTLTTARSPSADRGLPAGTTLPVLEEVGEGGSVGGRSRSAHSSRGNLRDGQRAGSSNQAQANPSPPQHVFSPPLGGRPPPTPPKDLPRDAAPMLPTPTFVDSPITLEPK